jgi:hypothetical protein
VFFILYKEQDQWHSGKKNIFSTEIVIFPVFVNLASGIDYIHFFKEALKLS